MDSDEESMEVYSGDGSSGGGQTQAEPIGRNGGIKAWRLILRNLPFSTTKEEVVGLVSGYGHVLEVELPKCKDKRFPNSSAGFCFVQFARRRDAEIAKAELHQSLFKERPLGVHWALSKEDYVTRMQEGRERAKWEELILEHQKSTNAGRRPMQMQEESEDESLGEDGLEEEDDDYNSEAEELSAIAQRLKKGNRFQPMRGGAKAARGARAPTKFSKPRVQMKRGPPPRSPPPQNKTRLAKANHRGKELVKQIQRQVIVKRGGRGPRRGKARGGKARGR